MGIPDHLTCLLKNLYAGHEATVRTGRGKTDWCSEDFPTLETLYPTFYQIAPLSYLTGTKTEIWINETK